MHRQLPLASSRLRKTLPVSKPKENTWVGHLSAGEPAAWLELMEQWSPRLYTYLLYQGIGEAAAQTLLQAIFAEVVQRVVGALRVTNLTVLIFAIASDHILRHRRQTADPTPPSPGNAVADTLPGPTRWLLQSLWQFTPEVQQVLLLHYLFEISLPEIAQIVGQPEDRLTKVLYRVKHELSAQVMPRRDD